MLNEINQTQKDNYCIFCPICEIKGKKMKVRGDTRWQLQGRSRQCDLHKSKILLRHLSHTLQKNTTNKNQNFSTSNPQPVQSFSMPGYIEKTGGLPSHQTLDPNLIGRHRPTGK
jgi:hypothetical protein